MVRNTSGSFGVFIPLDQCHERWTNPKLAYPLCHDFSSLQGQMTTGVNVSCIEDTSWKEWFWPHSHYSYTYTYFICIYIYIIYIYIQPFLLTRSGCDFHFVVRILRNLNVPTRKSQTFKIPGQNAPWRPLGNQQSNLTLFWHKCHVQEWKSQPTVKYRQHEGVKNTYVTRMCTSRCFFFII